VTVPQLWKVVSNGRPLGEFPEEQLREWAVYGHLTPDDLVWRSGMAEAAPASRVEPFARYFQTAHPAATAPATKPQYEAASQPYQPYQSQSGQTYQSQPSHLQQPAYAPQASYRQPMSPFPSGYQAAIAAPPKSSWSGYAITSLVFGVLGGIPLAIGFGIAALRSRHRLARRGSGMAVAGLGLAAGWLLILTAGVIPLLAHKSPSRSGGAINATGQISPADLRNGDCVEVPRVFNGPVASLQAGPCSTPHNAQVFATFDAAPRSYPGTTTLTKTGLADCQGRAGSFLGKSDTLLEVVVFVPNSTRWALGDRAEHCLLVNPSGDITDDIRHHG
jgi:hypothetical protein